MTDSLEAMLAMLLDGAVETLDISPDLQQTAISRYEDVGTWLAEHGNDWEIYSQGSFLLGTVVRPATETGEYDIDLVCRTSFRKENITQAQLKDIVGRELQAYRRWKRRVDPEGDRIVMENNRRCWTFGYPQLGFHLDVLPSILDVDHPPTGILLTDRKLRSWQHSNPIGYASWFRTRSRELETKLRRLAAAANKDVADVPTWQVRSTLQRVVQVLKWHAMLYFEDDTDNKPPSILLTTLAGLAYRGETDLFTATRSALAGMPGYIEKRRGRWWVENPAHPGENFTDKWYEYPERRAAFLAWHEEVSTVLNDLAAMRGQGIDVVVGHMTKAFSPDPIVASAKKYGEQQLARRTNGLLGVSSTGLISADASTPLRKHQFYGTDPRPRR
ncbi:nucleotidyltransferase [Pseudonocardia alni]|uniref:nucleotidyltransferase domain-containing protein n=1 Tax=Pseudonocardia alni TaxID=33907 RepID=UPI003713ECAC